MANSQRMQRFLPEEETRRHPRAAETGGGASVLQCIELDDTRARMMVMLAFIAAARFSYY